MHAVNRKFRRNIYTQDITKAYKGKNWIPEYFVQCLIDNGTRILTF